MNTTRHRTVSRALLLSLSLLASVSVSAGHTAPLEELVALGTRPNTAAAHTRLTATMDACATGVNAALKEEMRRQIAERARPRLRLTLAAANLHRG